MNLSQFVKRLRREVVAHPKKAAVLGLLVVVALWRWAPLIGNRTAADDSAATVAAEGPNAETPATPTGHAGPADKTPHKAKQPKYTWRQLAQWIDADPRTLTAAFAPVQRDPFLTRKTQPGKPEPEDEPQQVTPEVTPQSLGVVLSSTIVGSRRRVARINGKSYRQGDTVKLDANGQQIEFALVEVHCGRIVLARAGNRFDLRIPSATESGRIELSRNIN